MYQLLILLLLYFDSTFPRAFYRSRARPPAPPRIYTSRYI